MSVTASLGCGRLPSPSPAARGVLARAPHAKPALVRALGRLALGIVLGLALGACMGAQSPVQRLTDSAYDLNMATRFGRMDVAMPYVLPDAQIEFARRHAGWGSTLRILDLDLVSIRSLGPDTVAVDLDVTWHPVAEMTIRQSQITQRWKMERDDWRLVDEARVSGEPGLFGATEHNKPQAQATAPESVQTLAQ
jgi:hypothetical protein